MQRSQGLLASYLGCRLLRKSSVCEQFRTVCYPVDLRSQIKGSLRVSRNVLTSDVLQKGYSRPS